MSLINDALKKVQKQRTGETPSLSSLPSVGGQSAHQISPRGKSGGPNLALIGGGIAAAVIVVGAGAFFALREKTPANSSQPTALSPQPSEPAPSSQLPAPSSQLPAPSSQLPAPGSSPAPTFTLKTAPKSEDRGQRTETREPTTVAATAPSPVAKRSDEPRRSSSSEGGSASAPSPALTGTDPRVSPFRAQNSPPTSSVPQVSEPRPSLKLDPRAIEFIDNIKVAGIRASATDPKVLMNDRVYRPGSVVSGEMGLKLVEITANSLTFEDERGGRYTRTF